MQTPQTVPQDFALLAESCARMGSPFFAALLRRAGDAFPEDTLFQALFERYADPARAGLRFGGAAHYRALRGLAPEIAAHYPSTGGDGDADAAWEAIRRDMHAHPQAYAELFDRHIQTNEVARALPVLAAMLQLSRAVRLPLRIFEIGSSAGLVLNFDRYWYGGDGWEWGERNSPVALRNGTRSGAPANLDAPLLVAERYGCDLHPRRADSTDDTDALLGFVWPDQLERFERLRAALEVARAHPVPVLQGEGIAWAREFALPREGCATVLLHTVFVEHLPADARRALTQTVALLAANARPGAPFAWARMERDDTSYGTRLTVWPPGEETLLATSDGHAQGLRWLGAERLPA